MDLAVVVGAIYELLRAHSLAGLITGCRATTSLDHHHRIEDSHQPGLPRHDRAAAKDLANFLSLRALQLLLQHQLAQPAGSILNGCDTSTQQQARRPRLHSSHTQLHLPMRFPYILTA